MSLRDLFHQRVETPRKFILKETIQSMTSRYTEDNRFLHDFKEQTTIESGVREIGVPIYVYQYIIYILYIIRK